MMEETILQLSLTYIIEGLIPLRVCEDEVHFIVHVLLYFPEKRYRKYKNELISINLVVRGHH